jgi:rhamnosyl/mannosyltransferase
VSTANPDVIHVHMPNLSPLWLALVRCRAPLIVHWHSDVYTSLKSISLALLYPGYAVFQKMLLDQASAIIATSDFYRRASRPLQSYQEKTATIPLALDPARMSSRRDGQGRDPERPFALAAGRFTYYKGFDVLIRAAVHLSDDVQVIIAGDGPLLGRMRDLAGRLDLGDKILLPGRLNDIELHALMAHCRVFCLPSIDRTEAFGLVLLEAMHYARPLVSTRVRGSGMQLVNEHGVTGWSVEPEDELSLAHALKSLLGDEDLARKMGAEGKKRLEAEFHISRQVQDIASLYARVT